MMGSSMATVTPAESSSATRDLPARAKTLGPISTTVTDSPRLAWAMALRARWAAEGSFVMWRLKTTTC